MKPKINLMVLTAIVIISVNSTVNSQTNTSIDWAKNSVSNKDYSSATDSKMPNNLPEKLITNFNHAFPSAPNVRWSTTVGAFLANFSINEKPVMASFNKKGQFVYALIYGGVLDLPATVRQEIQKNYSSFIIYKVVEIRKPEVVNYQVILQNSEKFIDLRVYEDGQIQETKKVTKNEG